MFESESESISYVCNKRFEFEFDLRIRMLFVCDANSNEISERITKRTGILYPNSPSEPTVDCAKIEIYLIIIPMHVSGLFNLVLAGDGTMHLL